jgi:hypothetical protein
MGSKTSTLLPPEVVGAVNRLLQLPADQRLAISRQLADSVLGDEIEHAWSAEIAERIRQIETGEIEGIEGDQVFRKLEERLGESIDFRPERAATVRSLAGDHDR